MLFFLNSFSNFIFLYINYFKEQFWSAYIYIKIKIKVKRFFKKLFKD
jgi:hypothetical protein